MYQYIKKWNILFDFEADGEIDLVLELFFELIQALGRHFPNISKPTKNATIPVAKETG
jgi:hypothetical protein